MLYSCHEIHVMVNQWVFMGYENAMNLIRANMDFMGYENLCVCYMKIIIVITIIS